VKELIQLFEQNKGYLSARDVKSRTMQYRLQKLIQEGKVTRIKRGVYCLTDELTDRQMIDTERIVPGSVLCLYSAWSHYNLTLAIPDAWYLAVEKSRKVVLPDYPLVKLVFLKEEYYRLGIETLVIEGLQVKMYDIEKCVCDAVKYRNKTGMEVTAEIMRNYLSLPGRNIDKLVGYAKQMRIYNILKMYLEVQL
jgi:predicted transcriptional regulator of viral defense system